MTRSRLTMRVKSMVSVEDKVTGAEVKDLRCQDIE